MEIRKIKPEENIYAEMVSTIAFWGERDFTECLKDPLAHTDGYENTWGAFTDEGVMCSCMQFLPYTVMFDGHKTQMSGVGGVASLPEHRNGGSIRKIFEAGLNDAKDKGYVFSYLYPFSHIFYRKFGYEVCYEVSTVTLPIGKLSKYPKNGKLEFFKKDDDYSPYLDIYTAFIADKNLAVARSNEAFKDFINHDPYKSRTYTYLWRNDSNIAKSYMIFKPERDEHNGNRMKVKEFAWTDVEGLHGMLGCIPRFSAQFEHFVWEVPNTINPYTLIDEPYDVSVEKHSSGMNRIIDAEKALSMLKPPEGSGSVTIKLSDNFLPFNNGFYEIQWNNGGTGVQKMAEAGACIEMDIQTLTQLATGFITPNEAVFSGQLKATDVTDGLNKLFYKKHLFLTDRF